MALNSSGPMSIGGNTVGQSINLELRRSATATSSLNESSLRVLAGKLGDGTTISLFDFYGKSNYPNWSGSMSRTGGTGIVATHYGTGGKVLYGTYGEYSMGTITYTGPSTFTGSHNPGIYAGSFIWTSSGGLGYDSDIGDALDFNSNHTYYTANNYIHGFYASYGVFHYQGAIYFDGTNFSGSFSFSGATIATVTGVYNTLVGSNAYSGTIYLS